MAPPIPYNPTRAALFHPARERGFFAYPPYESTGALCAELSRLVYFGRAGEIDERQLRRFLRGVFDIRSVADVKNSQAFVVENDDLVVVVFRGTEGSDFSDILADLDFSPDLGAYVGRELDECIADLSER